MGKVPYREFFDHHLPFAWYSAAVLLWFSFGSFVKFRILYAVLTFLALFATALYIRKTKRDAYPFFLGFFFLYPFFSFYFWMHLFVADALAGLFFSILFWLLIIETYRKTLHYKTILVTSFIAFCLLFSSLTFVYIVGLMYIWMLYLLFRNKASPKQYLLFIGVAVAPYLLYGLNLLVTNSWKEFYISNFVYNTKLYIDIPNYTRGTHFNPLKMMLVLIYNFYQGYLPLIARIKEISFYMPIEFVVGLGTLTLFGLLLWEQRFVAVLYFFILSFSAPRSNVAILRGDDYQAGVFICLGILSAFIVFWRYKHVVFNEELIDFGKKAAVFVLGLFVLFSSLFLFKNSYDKFFQRYTQFIPSVNNVAFEAAFFDDIVRKGEYYWAGPYEPQELFFVREGSLPGKYISLLPQFKEDDYFRNTFIEQFEKNPPKVIVFKQASSIFSTPALKFGDFFVDWMKGKYTRVEYMDGVKVLKTPSEFNMAGDLYIRNEDKEEILSRLREKGYIE